MRNVDGCSSVCRSRSSSSNGTMGRSSDLGTGLAGQCTSMPQVNMAWGAARQCGDLDAELGRQPEVVVVAERRGARRLLDAGVARHRRARPCACWSSPGP